ncbi:MAG: VWA domain-containing protein [Candidatus Acidiferrales bacterium]
MRASNLFVGSAILFAAATVVIAAGQSSSLNSLPVSSSVTLAPASALGQQQSAEASGPVSAFVQQQSAEAPAPQRAPTAGSVLRSRTRLVTVDVVATDSHGNVVRDLKPEEFEVSDGGRQGIAQFSFVDKSASAGSAKVLNAVETRPKGFYTNQAELESLTTPPTVILLDAMNTEGAELTQARHDMLRLLSTLPPNTPVAVLLLEQSLVVVQDFTSDPALLRAALDKTISPGTNLAEAPENNSESKSRAEFAANGGVESSDAAKAIQSLENFERNNHAHTMDVRVATTLDTLTALAHYLGGYRGRKNLIWVSASFPIVLLPDADFAANADTDANTGTFGATSVYGGKIQDAANALTDAQVAVYPVDARGLESETIFSAAENPQFRPDAPSPSRNLSTQLNRERNARMLTQDTMDLLAQGTGGKTCKNTNNLSDCVQAALTDSSSYYELAYSPQNIKWDGSFHAISVKTTRPGVKLAYRRGYFAREAEDLANQSNEKRLQQTCMDFLPSTAIAITAQAVQPTKSDSIRYLMSVAPSALNFAADGPSHKLNAEMVACVYRAKGNSFQFFSRDLTQNFSDAAYQGLQASGLHGYVEVPKGGARRVRIAVLDTETGLTGAVDIPVRPEDFANAAAAGATAINLPEISLPRKKKESVPALDWDPPQVDASLPSISAAQPCVLPEVLKKAGQRADELVNHLENFDAQEQVSFEQTDSQGMIERSMEAKFDYLVDFGEHSGHKLHETRTLVAITGDRGLSGHVDVGLPAFALIFHPALQSDYEMRCEGLAQWNNQPAWVVYFQQKKKKRPRTVSIASATGNYPLTLKGRAWIAADSGQIMHLETNLMAGIVVLQVRANAVSVDYAPVKFKSQNAEVWLPQSAVVYTEYFDRRTIIRHAFSGFQLFSVRTQQVIQKPDKQ